MSDLEILDGGMQSCCIDTIRSFEGRDDDGVRIACSQCARTLVVSLGRWKWKPTSDGVRRTLPSGFGWGPDTGRWTRLPGSK